MNDETKATLVKIAFWIVLFLNICLYAFTKGQINLFAIGFMLGVFVCQQIYKNY